MSLLPAGAAMAADNINRFHEAEHKKKLELARAGRPGGGMAGGPKSGRALGKSHQAHLDSTRGAGGGVISPLKNNVPPTAGTIGKRKRKRKDDEGNS